MKLRSALLLFALGRHTATAQLAMMGFLRASSPEAQRLMNREFPIPIANDVAGKEAHAALQLGPGLYTYPAQNRAWGSGEQRRTCVVKCKPEALMGLVKVIIPPWDAILGSLWGVRSEERRRAYMKRLNVADEEIDRALRIGPLPASHGDVDARRMLIPPALLTPAGSKEIGLEVECPSDAARLPAKVVDYDAVPWVLQRYGTWPTRDKNPLRVKSPPSSPASSPTGSPQPSPQSRDGGSMAGSRYESLGQMSSAHDDDDGCVNCFDLIRPGPRPRPRPHDREPDSP